MSKADSGEEQELESGIGLGATAAALVQTAQRAGFAVAAAGQDRFRMARTMRPRWATISAIALLPFAGLGLLLLLVKTTASIDASVREHHKGVRVRLTGLGSVEFSALLQPALASPERQRAADVSFAPKVAGPSSSLVPSTPAAASSIPLLDAIPASRLEVQVSQHPPAATRPASSVRNTQPVSADIQSDVRSGGAMLVAADGTRFPLATVTVIGRDPADDGTFGVATKWAVADPSLSKTHAYVGPSGAGAWVVDRHSTNGTVVSAGDVVRPCAPGVRIEVPVGAFVVLGDLRLEVTAS